MNRLEAYADHQKWEEEKKEMENYIPDDIETLRAKALAQAFRERNKQIRDNKEYAKALIDLEIERAC